MKKLLTLAVAVAFVLGASAQKTISYEGADETVRLWDNTTAKYSNYETRDEKWHKELCLCQTSSCELYIFKADPAKNTGVAVAMLPGGSYTRLHLQISLAQWYASQGITAAIVKYRLPNRGHYEATLEDAEGAIRYLRTRTDLGINPAKVGVTGFSAGGHLSSWVSNSMPDSEKPAFAILDYAWINLLKSGSSAESKALPQFLGKGYKEQLVIDLSTQNMVTPTTPPTMLLLCDNDALVSPTSSTGYYAALVRNGVKAALHIYPTGGHSLLKHTEESRSEIIDFLKYIGILE